jgi:RNase P/RNase MRP subunit POP5
MSSPNPNKPPVTSILDPPTAFLLCELTVDGRSSADCGLCRDIIQSSCRVCLGNIGVGLARINVIKQCSDSVFIVSVASSHLSEVWAAMTITSSFEKRGTSMPPIQFYNLLVILFVDSVLPPPSSAAVQKSTS